MKKIVVLLCALMLTACANVPAQAPDAAAASTAAPAPPQTLKTFTHADLQNAAKYATDRGYLARAAMWQAIEQILTAAENQVAACKAAIQANLPKPVDGTIGLAMLTEMGAEAVAQGVPAQVKANCEPIVIPSGLLPLPRLP
jgi:hypothetical protein